MHACVVFVGGFEDKTVPTLVEKLVGHKIVDVDCGSEDAHMLALEDTGQSVNVPVCLPVMSLSFL